MSVNQYLTEKMQVVGGVTPVNMATGTNTGDYVCMKDYGRCTILIFKGTGGAGEDPVISLRQATDVADTSGKALNFTRIDYKIGTLSALGTFTTATQAAGSSYTLPSSAQVEAIAVIDIKAEDLDIDGGFDCLRASIADVGTTSQLGCVLYLLHEPRYGTVPLPSAIID